MPYCETLTRLIAFGFFGGPNPLSAEMSAGNADSVMPQESCTSLSVQDWQCIFEESRQQAVTALLYDAILKLPKEQRPPRSVLFHFVSMTKTIERDNRLREEALAAFNNDVMQPLGLNTVVVKGSSVASHYPQPLHRECGDNDLYTGKDTDLVSSYLEEQGIEVDRKDPRHVSFVFNDVDFEAHRYLLYHGDDLAWSFRQFNDSAIQQLSREESIFFIAKHTEHHAVFFHTPVRLRDLIDWCMLILDSGLDMSRFRAIKKGSDVDVFSELMSLYCNKLFGLDIDCQVPDNLFADDFETLYMKCHERHRLAFVRVVRRSWKYLRYGRKYRAIYGQSMFRRFYFNNLKVALQNKLS